MTQLREWRLAQHLSQAELGRMIGVTNNAISQFERGLIKPRLPLCEFLARALHIEVATVLQEFYGISLTDFALCHVAHEPSEESTHSTDARKAHTDQLRGYDHDHGVIPKPQGLDTTDCRTH